MTAQIAHLYALGCLGLIFFQIGLIAGLPLGAYTQGGRMSGSLDLAGRLMALVSIPVLLFMGLSILSAAGFPGLNWPAWTGWLALGISGLSCFANAVTPSKAERSVWFPVTLVMVGLAAFVMIVSLKAV